MAFEIDIAVDGGDWSAWHDVERRVEVALEAVFKVLDLIPSENTLSVLLTNDENMTAINAQWRGKNKPTNVLSFPAMNVAAGGQPGPLLGDVVVAYETVAREAEDEGRPFTDHLAHLFIHGILHLLGYDHENDDEAHVMESLEVDILGAMGIASPYATEPS